MNCVRIKKSFINAIIKFGCYSDKRFFLFSLSDYQQEVFFSRVVVAIGSNKLVAHSTEAIVDRSREIW